MENSLMTTVKAHNLSDYLCFDTHPLEVFENGTVAYVREYAPELCMEVDADDQSVHFDDSDLHAQAEVSGWELLTGYTGQYGYNGPVMHASEYIGGRLAEDILTEPGIYAAVVVETDDDSDDAAGWAIARKITN